MNKIKEKIKSLPKTPGVYIFKNSSGDILYIGKATNLKNRVGSYFSGIHSDGRPIETMIDQVTDIKTEETKSVLEALILESNLIKKYQPKYNIKEKDDKSFSYFTITKEDFPRVVISRRTDLEKNKNLIKFNFGPYTSKKQMEVALKIMQKIFPFHAKKQKTEKGCLDYQIGRCPGPYLKKISQKEYKKNIQGIKMILEGRMSGLLRKLNNEMKQYSEKKEFEKAAEIRNKIFALEHIQDIALISEGDEKFQTNLEKQKSKIKPVRIEAYDISNISGKHAVGSMIVFENDKPNKKEYRKFKIKSINHIDDVAMMKEVLNRRFNNKWAKPDLIFLDGGVGHLNMGAHILSKFKLEIPLVSIAKGADRKKIEINVSGELSNKKIKDILSNKKLIKQIMDEAHRFAIIYHRKVRKNELFQ